MPINLPDVILRYFERDADRDIDLIVNLFANDATVIDEGEERHGTAEIRAWQTGAPPVNVEMTSATLTAATGSPRRRGAARRSGRVAR
jgi:ketosteroid isomerase-like protein